MPNIEYKKDVYWVDYLRARLGSGRAMTHDELQSFVPDSLKNLNFQWTTKFTAPHGIELTFSWNCPFCTCGTPKMESLERVISIRDTHLKYLHPDDDPVDPVGARRDEELEFMNLQGRSADQFKKKMDQTYRMVSEMAQRNAPMTLSHAQQILDFLALADNCLLKRDRG